MTGAVPKDASAGSVASALVATLDQALRALGRAGEPDLAARLAAEAWVQLSGSHPREAERLNATLHALAKEIGRRRDSDRGGERGGPAEGETVLDVRALPPAERHGLIFRTYEGLPRGGRFVLVNDHDPKPLYYQFAAEEPGRFTWEYVESGPEVWRVRIGRV